MRIYFAGNEDVCRHHLPVVQSKATEFAELTKRRGLQQNTFYLTFDDTGASAVVSYHFGQLDIGISAPFPPSGGEKEVVERKRLYEWNKVADTDAIAGGQDGVLLSKGKVYSCVFDAAITVTEFGEISLSSETVSDEVRELYELSSRLPFRFGYAFSVDSPFFISVLCGFNHSFIPAYAAVYLPPYGMFALGYNTYSPIHYFRGDYPYLTQDGTAYIAKNFPLKPLQLGVGKIYRQYKSDAPAVFTQDQNPDIGVIEYAGSNLHNVARFEHRDAYNGSGLWPGDGPGAIPYDFQLSFTFPKGGDIVVWLTGDVTLGDVLDEQTRFDPNPDGYYLRLYSSTINIKANVGFIDSTGVFSVAQHDILVDFVVTSSNPSIFDAVLYPSTYAPTHYIGGGLVLGDFFAAGNFALTIPAYSIAHMGRVAFVYISTTRRRAGSPDVPIATNNINPPTTLRDVFIYENGGVFACKLVSHVPGVEFLWSEPAFNGSPQWAAEDAGVSLLEFVGDTLTFFGIKYGVAPGTLVGVFEIVRVGTEAHLYEHIGFFDRVSEHFTCYNTDVCMQMRVFFSDGCELFMVKGSPSSDGVWRKSGTSCSKIIEDVSMYPEPVYISRDGSCLAFKDKIFIDDILVAQPVECVGVFHTHDFYVDKISAAQFAIKKLDGTTVSVTPDGLYNYYELTDDSSYAMLSKAWVTLPGLEQESRATGNVLIIAFADGPVKFEMADRSLSREVPNRDVRTTSRFSTSGDGYIQPLTWCRLFAPGLETSIAYGRQSARLLVSCRDDGFAERLHNFATEERVSAFLWHHELGLFQRLMNTVTEIPYDVLNTETRTIVKTEE